MVTRVRNNGKVFEDNFKDSAEKQNLLYERFPDSNKFGQNRNKFGQNNGGAIRFTLNSPCDCFLFDSYSLFYVELKATKNTSISFNQPSYEDTKKKVMIKPHQVRSLLKRTNFDNVYAMLVLDYADRTNSKGETTEGGTYAIPIVDFVEWTRYCGKKSINKDDAEQIGIKVDRRKKKVNYEYDIVGMLKTITMVCNE
nr:MAG TPA: penicillin-binding protein-related factor A [Caudoviricetes sp.]